MRTNKLTTAQTAAIGTKVQLVHVGRSNEIIMPATVASAAMEISTSLSDANDNVSISCNLIDVFRIGGASCYAVYNRYNLRACDVAVRLKCAVAVSVYPAHTNSAVNIT